MAHHQFNDLPISNPIEDAFGLDAFATAIARSIMEIKGPVGVTLALNGPWGAGKSSAINLIRHCLSEEEKAGNIDIVDFKCWWFRGEEALTLAFLQELTAVIEKSLGDKAKELVSKIGRRLLQAGPVIGQAVSFASGGTLGGLLKGTVEFGERYFKENESIEKVYSELARLLAAQKKRYLVVIDDIDRLTPEEAILIFRLVRSVGHLPNVVYVLAYDRELAEKIVGDRYPAEGPHYLEKIVQATFDVPAPQKEDIEHAVLASLDELEIVADGDNDLLRMMNIFYDLVSPYLAKPRDYVRLLNMLSVTWPAVKGEVNPSDYLAIELIRLFEPSVFRKIRASKHQLCGVRGENENREEMLKQMVENVSTGRKEAITKGLMRLFPRLEEIGYTHEFVAQWDAERRVCSERHFDTYFRMAIGSTSISRTEIDEFIAACGNKEWVKARLLRAAEERRRGNRSMMPAWLDEINTYAHCIAKEDIVAVVSAIFEVADSIYREEDSDRGIGGFGNTHLRIHWLIRRLLFGKSTLSERTEIFSVACKNAQIGWLVDFTSSALDDYFPREGRTVEPDEKCLVSREEALRLKQLSLERISAMAMAGELLATPLLADVLFRWRDFCDDEGKSVKAWTASQINSPRFLAAMARAFTGESWSQGIGMFDLADAVSMRTVRAQLNGLDSLIDVSKFRRNLENAISSGELEEDERRDVEVFLAAWAKQEKGDE